MNSSACCTNTSNREVDLCNGLILNSCFLPEEVLIHILSFVDTEPLALRCRLVCTRWRDIITDCRVWKLKMQRSDVYALSKNSGTELKELTVNYPWFLFYWILKKSVPFEKNLLVNNCGQSNLAYWTAIHRTSSWNIEAQPVYADPLPESDDFGNNKCCFSTSYPICSKKQLIDLRQNGFPSKLLDEFQPPITISEWYAGRYDCGCKYWLSIDLLRDDKDSLVAVPLIERIRTQWQGQEWTKVTATIKKYGPGLRYISYKHGGKDTQFWRGYYGSKMAGGVAKISLPEIRGTEDQDSAEEPIITIL